MEWRDVLREISGAAATNAAVMDLALAEIADAPGPPIVGIGVDALADGTGARTLGDLTRVDDAEDVLRESLPRPERRAFLSAFSSTVRKLATQIGSRKERANDSTAHATRPGTPDPRVVPPGGEELDAWLAHFGISDELHRPIRFRIGPSSRDFFDAPARQCIDLVRYPDLGSKYHAVRASIRAPIEEIVREAAIANAPRLARRTAFLQRRRAPSDPWVVERIRLLTELAKARGATGPAPIELRYPLASVAFRSDPLGLEVFDGRWRHEVDLGRVAVTNRAAFWHGAPERPRFDAAILECAIDALCDPEGRALAELVAWRATPTWKHMLRAFEGAATAVRAEESENEERLAFRLPKEVDDIPTAVVQKARKGGGFTAGRQIDPHDALRLPGLTPLDHEILETLSLVPRAGGYGARETLRTRLRLYELLTEHPRVLIEGDHKEPVRLRRARATLRVVPVDGAFRVQVGVGAAALSPHDALTRSRQTGVLAAAEPGGRSVSFAEVDPVSSALFSALASNPDDLPSEGLDALLGVLATYPAMALDLDLPEQARGTPVPADSRLVVRLALGDEGSLSLALRVRALAGTPAVLPGAAPRHAYGTRPDGARIFATRDLDDEEARAEHLLAALPLAGATRHGPFDVRIDDVDRACDVVATLSELGDAIVTEWPEGEKIRVASTLDTKSLKLKITRKRDWFGIDGGADVEGAKVGIHALLEAARAGRRFVRLEGGALAAIGRDLRARLARADDVLQEARDGLVAHPPAVAAITELVDDEKKQLSAAREWLELRARIERAETYEPELPDGLDAELREYQLEGYRWLMRLAECGTGACLADDMGLGKTIQSLAVLQARRALGPALVVAPTSVGANWADEAARFTKGLNVVPYRGDGRRDLLAKIGPGTVLVTSYDLMLRDIDALEGLELATVVFDEAHALKNGTSKRALAARRIHAAFRVALSGTPIENHTGELWSLFRVIVPGLFGSWERFRERFAGPIERDRDPGRRAALSALIRPYLLRRTKREVSPELPPRTDVVRFVVLSPAERELYEAERLRAIEAANRGATDEAARFAVLAALTRLRQLACHPRLRHAESTAASSKLASVCALVEELRDAGHRALVFSQFTSHLALVAEALRARGVTFVELDGSTPAEARADRVRRFQAGEADLFLISLKAGGVGLNLTAADYVLHLDPWWNPAAEDQASDRAHRIGQDKPVTVVRFIARGTIEETVLALHGEKRELAEALLSGGDVAARLSTKELVKLMEATADAAEATEDDDASESEGAD
jgi:superfamily II DNA or RNA helicase